MSAATFIRVAVVLAIWGVLKLPWEIHLEKRREQLMFGSLPPAVSMEMRDQLGQGLTVAALGGFRGVAANFLWLSLTEAWADRQWSRVWALAEMAVMLQPRVVFFWENASWHLAWNASVSAEKYGPSDNPDRRAREARRWIEAGRDMLERGITVIPERYHLYQQMAQLYWQRLEDYERAAHYYRLAASRPGAPVYLERFVGYGLENAGLLQEAYDYWLELWNSYPTHPDQGPHQWPVIRERILKLEKELNIPTDKSFFSM